VIRHLRQFNITAIDLARSGQLELELSIKQQLDKALDRFATTFDDTITGGQYRGNVQASGIQVLILSVLSVTLVRDLLNRLQGSFYLAASPDRYDFSNACLQSTETTSGGLQRNRTVLSAKSRC
jgi:hypothetical protein